MNSDHREVLIKWYDGGASISIILSHKVCRLYNITTHEQFVHEVLKPSKLGV